MTDPAYDTNLERGGAKGKEVLIHKTIAIGMPQSRIPPAILGLTGFLASDILPGSKASLPFAV